MPYSDIIVEVHEGVATITLNRPDRLNAFAERMREELREAIEESAGREDVNVIVITGAGRGFCTGADVAHLREIAERGDEASLREQVEAGQAVVLAIREARQPVIASVNGPAAGAGASLALACDLRIAAESASIGLTFNRIGLHPDWGATYTLPRLVGPAMAAELIFTGAMISARDGLRLGIFNRVVTDERLAEETGGLARDLAAKPALPLYLAKRAMQRSLEASLREMLDFEMEAQLQCGRSADAREGIEAFVEKREPRFGRR